MADTETLSEVRDQMYSGRDEDTLEALKDLVGDELEPGDTPAEGRSPDAETTPTEPAATDKEAAVVQPPPEEAAADEPDVEELLKTAVALDFTVNGESRSFDGISVIPGQGAIITEAALPALRDRLQQAESARNDARNLYGKLQEYETMSFKSGEQEYRGRQAFDQLTVENARLVAAANQAFAVLSNPAALAELLTFDPQKGEFILNETAKRLFQREAAIAVRDSEWNARNGLTQRQTQTQQESSVAEKRSSAITGAVQQWAAQFPELTADDITKANAHFARIGSVVVRPATAEEATAAGVKPGDLVIDHPLIHEFLSDRASLRKGASSAAATAASTATTASKENASRLAAAQVGKKPAKRSAAPTAPTPRRDKRDEWEEQKAQLQSGRWSSTDE